MAAKTQSPSKSRGENGSRRRRGGGRQRVPALGYASVPPDLPLDGPDVEAQRDTIERACRELGLELIDVMRDHQPEGSDGERRPGLFYALERIDAGEAACLVVSGLGRLSGDVGGLATVLDRLERDNGRLVAVDVGLDTETPAGRLAVSRRPGVAAAPHEPVEAAPVEQPTPAPVEQPTAAPVEQPTAAPVEQPPAPPLAQPVVATGELMKALGYASVPAEGETATTEELEGQRHTIERACERLGVELVEIVREREPKAGKTLERAGVSYLIDRLAAGDASCLVVTGLDRLSHSAAELGTLVQWLEQSKVRLVAVELDLDTLSPAGQATARALASVGNWERERLSERTRKGLAAARAKRRASGGPAEPDWVSIRKRIAVMRADGMTLQAIADVLNDEGIPTPRGGVKWRPSSVQTAAGYKRRSRTKNVDDLPAKRADS